MEKDSSHLKKNNLINEIEGYFLNRVKQTLKDEYNLPWECLSIERHDDIYKMVFIMKEIPFEVYFNRYEILDEVAESVSLLSRLILDKKIFHLKVFVDYRSKDKNLLYSV